MALTYCEVCGVLIKGGGADVPEGVICGECFASRQVMLESDELIIAEPAPVEKIQFGCPYCSAVLRVAVPPGERMHVRCPKCTETFYADCDGTVAAQMEGNTTQVLLQEEVLPDLSPPPVSGTQPLNALGRGSETVALRPLGSSLGQPQVFQSGGDSGGLDLLPDGVRRPTENLEPIPSLLRASDEGRIDLDTSKLRAKTQRFGKAKQTGKHGKQTGKTGKQTGKIQAPARRGRSPGGTDKIPRPPEPPPEPAASEPEEPIAKRKGKIPKGKKASERFRSVSSGAMKRAIGRTNQMEKEGERRAVRTALAWGFVLAPALLAGFLGILVGRDAGLVDAKKPTGRFFRSAGLQGDRAIRAINDLLPPASRDAGLSKDRPAGTAAVGSAGTGAVGSAGTATVDSAR